MKIQSHEPIFVQVNDAGVPSSFRWRQLDYPIDLIDRVWRQSYHRQRSQRMYRIRSRRCTFLILHDRTSGRWTMIKSPLRVRCGLFVSEMFQSLIHSGRTESFPLSGKPV